MDKLNKLFDKTKAFAIKHGNRVACLGAVAAGAWGAKVGVESYITNGGIVQIGTGTGYVKYFDGGKDEYTDLYDFDASMMYITIWNRKTDNSLSVDRSHVNALVHTNRDGDPSSGYFVTLDGVSGNHCLTEIIEERQKPIVSIGDSGCYGLEMELVGQNAEKNDE